MDKRASEKYYILISLILGIIILAIAFYFIFQEYFLQEDIDWETCRQSLIMRSGNVANILKQGQELSFPFKCKTQVVEIDFKDFDRAGKLIADTMAQCWALFSEGKLDLYSTDFIQQRTHCFHCARIHFTEDVKEYYSPLITAENLYPDEWEEAGRLADEDPVVQKAKQRALDALNSSERKEAVYYNLLKYYTYGETRDTRIGVTIYPSDDISKRFWAPVSLDDRVGMQISLSEIWLERLGIGDDYKRRSLKNGFPTYYEYYGFGKEEVEGDFGHLWWLNQTSSEWVRLELNDLFDYYDINTGNTYYDPEADILRGFQEVFDLPFVIDDRVKQSLWDQYEIGGDEIDQEYYYFKLDYDEEESKVYLVLLLDDEGEEGNLGKGNYAIDSRKFFYEKDVSGRWVDIGIDFDSSYEILGEFDELDAEYRRLSDESRMKHFIELLGYVPKMFTWRSYLSDEMDGTGKTYLSYIYNWERGWIGEGYFWNQWNEEGEISNAGNRLFSFAKNVNYQRSFDARDGDLIISLVYKTYAVSPLFAITRKYDEPDYSILIPHQTNQKLLCDVVETIPA